jgi:ATP-dependent DNA helicase RecG
LANVEKLIAELTDCDFKEALEVKKPKSRLKSVSAFANERGGGLIFGMADDKTIVGLADIKRDIDIISKQIKEKITPLPTVDFRAYKTDEGKDILFIEVAAGNETPYFYSADGNLIAYIRVGSDDVAGSEVHVDMFDDRLEIYSPGGMADGTLIQEREIENVPQKHLEFIFSPNYYLLLFSIERG